MFALFFSWLFVCTVRANADADADTLARRSISRRTCSDERRRAQFADDDKEFAHEKANVEHVDPERFAASTRCSCAHDAHNFANPLNIETVHIRTHTHARARRIGIVVCALHTV